MTRIKPPLVEGEMYHVFNRGVAFMPIFTDRLEYKRAMNLISYYRNETTPLSYSHFMRSPLTKRVDILEEMRSRGKFLIKIIALCLMPNHFHLVLQQKTKKGISKFMANFQNSYARYFNIKNNRVGPLLQGDFKAVLIETKTQFLHVVRYVHLNPYSSSIVKTADELLDYEFSSLPDYVGLKNREFVEKDTVMNYFNSPQQYKEFVLDHAD
ncbi:hypothetical protein A3G65_03430, partial [Candidatus Roizmanbacteria bacterium RIFCSPLOWO2_12_FULL_37_7b]